jgi:UDP-glucose-4-epimerase GalE
LVAGGKRVVVLDNLVYGHREAIVDEGVDFIEGDLGDREVLDRIFTQYDVGAVMHFAAYAYVGESVTEPSKYYHNNLAAPLVLLDAMRAHGVHIFIFSSTCATYGNPQYVPMDEQHPQNPINPYGASKWMLERVLADYAHAYGLKYAALRYFNASGCSADGLIGEDHQPETHLIPLVLEAAAGLREHITVFGTDYPTPDGSCIRDYIHVHDLARAHILAIETLADGAESFQCNLGTGIGHSVKELIAEAEKVTGKPIPVVYGDRRAGDPPELVAAPARAKELLGWEAEYKDLTEILRTAWAWIDGPRKGRY